MVAKNEQKVLRKLWKLVKTLEESCILYDAFFVISTCFYVTFDVLINILMFHLMSLLI